MTQAWESSFLIELPLVRKNYTTAFMQFVQTLERLLYIQCCEQNWIDKGFVTLGNSYQPGMAGLIDGWRRFRNLSEDNKWYKLLNRIRNKRNQVIHSAEPVTFAQIRNLWTDGGLFTVSHSEDPQVVKALMMDVLEQVSPTKIEKLLVRSLYQFGMSLLQTESVS